MIRHIWTEPYIDMGWILFLFLDISEYLLLNQFMFWKHLKFYQIFFLHFRKVMELLQLNNSISPKSEWALGTSMSMCERLTVPLLTTIMFQNASSWRLVFSIKSLASAKAEISGDIFEWLDTADHTTGYTFGRLRCCCWKNSGKNVSRRSYYWWICPLPPYILCFWHGPEVLSKLVSSEWRLCWN